MRALEIARSLRSGEDVAKVAERFVQGLSAGWNLDDVALLTERFSRAVPPPPHSFFDDVARHFVTSLKTPTSEHRVNVNSAVSLVEAFARVRFNSCDEPVGLVCLAAPPTSVLAAPDVLRFVSACSSLESQHNPAIRSFTLLQLQASSFKMDARTLAELAAQLARIGVYSGELSAAVELALLDNPWAFKLEDLLKLVHHFSAWRLGPIQKRAFQSLGNMFSESAEFLSPQDVFEVIECFTQVGSLHEILLQHMHLALLLERGFAELTPSSISKLVSSMSKVEYYHNGLLREIVSHLGENPELVAQWKASDLSGALKTLGLAPVHVPAPTLRLFGCRYASLLSDMDASELRDFLEVAARFPELVRVILRRGGARKLARLFDASLPMWGARASADALLALLLAMDVSPSEHLDLTCACMLRKENDHNSSGFRTDQPEEQLQVIIKAARQYNQRDFRPPAVRFNPRPGAILKDLFLIDDANKALTIQKAPRGCRAPWSALGRRSKPVASLSCDDIIGTVFQHLQGSLCSGGRDFSELPGAPAATALLAEEDEGAGQTCLADSRNTQMLPESVSPTPVELLPFVIDANSGTHGAFSNRPGDGGSSSSNADVMRRSELLEIAAQTFASLQLCFGAGAPHAMSHIPKNYFRVIEQLLPVVHNMLRPRRHDDSVAQKYNLGPLRLEAFVRRPDEPLSMDVYKTLRRIAPYLPHLLDFAEWPARRCDQIEGFPTGGALLSLRREVEVPPFVICMVLRHVPTGSTRNDIDLLDAGSLE